MSLESSKTLAPSSILVTGGCGFVGSWLVAQLLERAPSARITVIDDLSNGRATYLPDSPRVDLRVVDLTEGEEVADIVAEVRPDWVFHLAALHYIPYCDRHPARTLHVNVVGTQNLLDACRPYPPAVLVAVSTVAVYPVSDGANAEDDPVGPVDIYGLSKATNEAQVRLYARHTSTCCAVARLSNVYGPRETNPHVIPEILSQMNAGRDRILLGNVKPKRDYVYVADVASALARIASRALAPYRVYNVGSGREFSVEEIVAELGRVSGRSLDIVVDRDRVRPTDRMHLLCDLGRIRGELNWEPRYGLREGLGALWECVGQDKSRAAVTVPAGRRLP